MPAEVFISRNTKHLFNVGAEHVHLKHDLFRGGGNDRIPHFGAIQLSNIAKHHDIAVEIKTSVILREKLGDKETVVGRLRIVVAQMQFTAKGIQLFLNVNEFHRYVIGFHCFKILSVLFRERNDQNVNFIKVVFRRIVDQRAHRNAKIGRIAIIGCKKDRNDLFAIHTLV